VVQSARTDAAPILETRTPSPMLRRRGSVPFGVPDNVSGAGAPSPPMCRCSFGVEAKLLLRLARFGRRCRSAATQSRSRGEAASPVVIPARALAAMNSACVCRRSRSSAATLVSCSAVVEPGAPARCRSEPKKGRASRPAPTACAPARLTDTESLPEVSGCFAKSRPWDRSNRP
jgi:hypothetical protein